MGWVVLVQRFDPEATLPDWYSSLFLMAIALWPLYRVWMHRKAVIPLIRSNPWQASREVGRCVLPEFKHLFFVWVVLELIDSGYMLWTLGMVLTTSGAALAAYAWFTDAIVYEVWYGLRPAWDVDRAIEDERGRLLETVNVQYGDGGEALLAYARGESPTLDAQSERGAAVSAIWAAAERAKAQVRKRLEAEGLFPRIAREVFWGSVWGFLVWACFAHWDEATAVLRHFRLFHDRDWAVNLALGCLGFFATVCVVGTKEAIHERLAKSNVRV
jgi:hypothetical protein